MVEFRSQFFVSIVVDSDANTMLGVIGFAHRPSITLKVDGIAGEFDGKVPDVVDVGLVLKKRLMLA